ncbi:MAG: glutamate dehydrogenase [Bacteroidia bacterium]|nr:glutamate dehydrogenase [Bacteroidia bacterium]NNM22285.1 glutamate dehydrogenase [Flavobacteriaceae bacterium]
MNTKILLVVFLFFAVAKQQVMSQLGFSHEIGAITGPIAFYSDYGQRYDFETNVGNVGFGIGLIHYLNFSYRADCNCYTRDTYFNDHFKVRSEIDYHKTNFDHLGKWVEADRTTITADQLRAMKGSTTVFDIGAQLEYFPLSIRDFAAGAYKIAPFGSFGVHWVSFDPEVYSELGPLNTPLTTPPKYFNAFQQEGDSTWSIVMSTGIRYKLTVLSDLMLDARWQYYFSNWVDGLNPSFENNGVVEVPENKANDWIFWLNVGYIYYLD